MTDSSSLTADTVIKNLDLLGDVAVVLERALRMREVSPELNREILMETLSTLNVTIKTFGMVGTLMIEKETEIAELQAQINK